MLCRDFWNLVHEFNALNFGISREKRRNKKHSYENFGLKIEIQPLTVSLTILAPSFFDNFIEFQNGQSSKVKVKNQWRRK